jgi:hypothetical protein
MPISVRYKNDDAQECVIRPAPLVSINTNVLRNKDGKFGTSYSISLKGYLLRDLGFPLARDSRTNNLFQYHADTGGYVDATANAGPYLSFDTLQSHSFQEGAVDNRPQRQNVPYECSLDAILFKQKVLRSLFSIDGQRVEISPIHTDEPSIVCYPSLSSISFSEGIYVDLCEYTIELECDTLLNNNLEVDIDGNPIFSEGMEENDILQEGARFIENYSESWSLEGDDAFAESTNLTRTYRITRNISATGKDHYGPSDLGPNGLPTNTKKKAWEQARDYVQFKINNSVASGYPNVMGRIGSGIINLVDSYNGYNHTITENIGIDDGSYSVTENWLLASGTAYENYSMTVSQSVDNPFVSVSINGEIKGLSSISPSGTLYGGNDGSGITPYKNALSKYYEVSSSGKFGIGSDVFKRADNTVAVKLNAQPKTISLALNEHAGTINYSLDFDNRPTNIISGVLFENISISDTYPGDVFAVIPIMGRKTGPILQAIGGRTEYKRDLNLEIVLDYTDLPYGSGRSSLLKKPSLVEPIRSQLINLIRDLSPEKEPGVRKWFVNAPVENWSPKEGRYSLSASWVYELSK